MRSAACLVACVTGLALFAPPLSGNADPAQDASGATAGRPTNFSAIPFNNTVPGHRRQTLSSAANTRLGMQMNTRVLGFDVLGLVETDFLGYVIMSQPRRTPMGSGCG